MTAIQCFKHKSDIGEWRHFHRDPHPFLRPYVIRYRGLEGYRRREPGIGIPSPTGALVIGFGTWSEIRSRRRKTVQFRSERAYLSGLREHSIATAFEAGYSGVIVDLTPLGVRRLTGAPVSLLSNGQVNAAEFLNDCDTLQDELKDGCDWSARFEMVEHFIGNRIENSVAPHPIARLAWERIVATHGSMRVRCLASELGVSTTKLVSLFREEIGLSPKRVLQLVRLDLALGLATAGDAAWSRLAVRSGYYDQAHLANDFKRRLDMTPTELRTCATGRRVAGNLPLGVLFADEPLNEHC